VFAPTRYIAWALRHYGRVPHDLASSGVPLVSARDFVPATQAQSGDPAMYAALISGIARHNERAEDEVVPALGTSHALFLAYAAMLCPGDEVLVEDPGYEPLLRAAEGLGAGVRRFTRREERGFAVDPADVAARVTPRTRAIVVTNLHNPSGVRVPDATLEELAAIASARGAYLLVDEVYAAFDELAPDGVFRKSARRLGENVVAVSSLTKCYGLGMQRIGWMLGPPAVVERAKAASVATVGHLPLAHAASGVAAFAQLPSLARRARALFLGKREIAEKWIATFPQARWSAPREGLFGLVTLPGRGDLLPEVERLAERAGVLVGPGSFFGAPSSFRLSWASCEAKAFASALDELAGLVTS
jgi:aspartate/methionine/tyrosine aminotransferase